MYKLKESWIDARKIQAKSEEKVILIILYVSYQNK